MLLFFGTSASTAPTATFFSPLAFWLGGAAAPVAVPVVPVVTPNCRIFIVLTNTAVYEVPAYTQSYELPAEERVVVVNCP